jgi:hypothetical protein
MRRTALAASLVVSLVGACMAACSSGKAASDRAGDAAVTDASDEAQDDEAGDAADDVVHTYAPTFGAVYGEILSPVCAGLFCHGASETGNLPMATPDMAYAALVNVPAHGPNCADSGLLRVAPGDPDASLLYLKVTNPPCGLKMPPSYQPYLDDRETAQIANWIAMGARDD